MHARRIQKILIFLDAAFFVHNRTEKICVYPTVRKYLHFSKRLLRILEEHFQYTNTSMYFFALDVFN